MLNHIVLMGRRTRDPELRYTGSNIPVASFTVAVDRDFGKGEERATDFINVVAWRQTGEFVSKYFTKGSMIVVSGRLQMLDWTDRDGNKRTSAEVVADNVYFGDSKKSRDDGEGSYGSYGRPDSYRTPARPRFEQAHSTASTAFQALDDADDGELPF